MIAKKSIAIVATMDTKGRESDFLRTELQGLGADACLIDIAVMGQATTTVDVTYHQIASAAGQNSSQWSTSTSREETTSVMIAGAAAILQEKIRDGQIQGVVGLGGTQGTPNCAQIFQQLPYGFPKIILSTVASGDTSSFMDIKDITMMPSVADILGLNPFTRRILSNLAGAAYGMALVSGARPETRPGKPVVGMTNLGVLTHGANQALAMFERAGYEVITFHAVGTGGRAMEQMMREGLITAVFDYALGEIADEVYGGLRAANSQRLTVARQMGIPQVICPGGAEHIGLWVDQPNQVPVQYAHHQYVFHNPYVFAPRLNAKEIRRVAQAICERLQGVSGDCVFLIPEKGVSRYSIDGGPLADRNSDAAFFETLRSQMPASVEVRTLPHAAEDPEFVSTAVNTLVSLMQERH